jgi:hypothetical protein
MNKSKEDNKEYLLKEERKASECVTDNIDGTEKSKRTIMYLKYFDPETNSYCVKAVHKQNKSISNSSSLNSLNK